MLVARDYRALAERQNRAAWARQRDVAPTPIDGRLEDSAHSAQARYLLARRERLVNRINWEPTWINSLTANTPAAIRTPIHFPTDRECLERIMPTVGRLDLSELTFGWIRNTMELTRIALSENTRAGVEANPNLEIEATIDFDFDGEANLISPFVPVEETAGAH